MRSTLISIPLTLTVVLSAASCATVTPMTSPPVTRTDLLTASFDTTRTVERVEIKRVEMAPNLQSGLHLHPCPVVGVVTEGSVLFQIEGEPPHVLAAGDAFFEPADVRVSHFDAQDEGATFVAHYLLGPGEHDLIRMLE